MSKNDGTLQYRGQVTPLMELLLRRRSCRKYADGSATDAQLDAVLDTARLFADRCAFRAPRLLVVRGEERVRVVRAAMRGLMVTVNPWLSSAAAPHLLLCAAVWPVGSPGPVVERALGEAAMTMQVALLAATELGLASCWMAGIDHGAVEEAFPLPDGATLVAISPVGLPPTAPGLWDRAVYHLASKRRKPLAALWMKERWPS